MELEAQPNSHILVVDDNTLFVGLVETMLVAKGYSVTTAADGDSALKWVNEHGQPDLLLTDVIMHEMDGPELYRRLHHGFPDMPVIFMSGSAGYDSSFTLSPLLIKPFRLEELTSMVASTLSASASHISKRLV